MFFYPCTFTFYFFLTHRSKYLTVKVVYTAGCWFTYFYYDFYVTFLHFTVISRVCCIMCLIFTILIAVLFPYTITVFICICHIGLCRYKYYRHFVVNKSEKWKDGLWYLHYAPFFSPVLFLFYKIQLVCIIYCANWTYDI